MRRTASDLKMRLRRSENTSSPFVLVLMSPMVIGPVWRQAIDEFEGSMNQFPFDSRSIRLRSKRVMWQVTPSTLGSGTASTTMLLPVQSLRKLPTSSAAAGKPAARVRKQAVINGAWRIGPFASELLPEKYPQPYPPPQGGRENLCKEGVPLPAIHLPPASSATGKSASSSATATGSSRAPRSRPASASRQPRLVAEALAKLLQQPAPHRPIHRPPVVGINHAEIPELAALIGVGDAGRGQLDQGLRQAVDRAGARQALDKAVHVLDEGVGARAVERTGDEAAEHRLVFGIGIAPARMLLGLAHRLGHGRLDALGEGGERRSVVGPQVERPSAGHRLVKEILVVAVGRRHAIHLAASQPVEPRPERHAPPPVARQLG